MKDALARALEQNSAALEALDRAFALLELADFRNGVTDPSGTMDEGDCLARYEIDRIARLAARARGEA